MLLQLSWISKYALSGTGGERTGWKGGEGKVNQVDFDNQCFVLLIEEKKLVMTLYFF